MFNALHAQECILECPESLDATCDISEIPAYSNYNDFLNDGGGISGTCNINASSFVLLAEISDGGYCPETVTRIYQISDDNDETYQCSQEIIINDNEDPVITCPPDDIIECDINDYPKINTLNEFLAAGGTVYDNCEINEASFYTYEVDFEYSCNNIVLREFLIHDHCGNNFNCQQYINIYDYSPPIITCPPNEIYPAPASQPYTTYTEFTAGGGSANDNCAIDENSFYLQQEITDDDNNPTFITRTYEISDLCENRDNCTQTITFCTHTSNTLFISECESYTSPSGKYTWNTSGIYKDTIPNASLCDSLLTIDLTIEDNVVNEGGDDFPNSLRMSLACASFLDEIRIEETIDTLNIIMPLVLQDDIIIKGNETNPPVVRLDFTNSLLTNAPYGIKIENGKTITFENVILLEQNNPNQVKLLLNEGTLKINQSVSFKTE
ncbi:hypothetical protein GCM10007940_27770 [Portibacter lacus]|uniref:Gliding motility-associated C-terminal domain-containing protein n=2 Tax=Portibacter lacus TaxID=1099794 RepID=A0AA37WF23_9BACT|nr:hypothetical protein GCM10007940_27770 [Portibacter lacus]